MMEALARRWWAVALRGVSAILFGAIALAMPGITLVTLILLFGAFTLVHGVVALFARHIAQGLVGIAVGLVAFLWPGLTGVAFLFLIAAWSIVTGVFEIVAGIRLRKVISGEWMLVLGGVLSVLFGVFVAMRPGAGALAIIWLIGAYAIVFGFMLVGLSLRLKGLKSHAAPAPAA
jgi:uncharacterized membrane protein HdeD (DUF308 family)